MIAHYRYGPLEKETEQAEVTVFFLCCVIVAGIYGAYSTRKIKLFYIQAIPAIFALILIIINS